MKKSVVICALFISASFLSCTQQPQSGNSYSSGSSDAYIDEDRGGDGPPSGGGGEHGSSGGHGGGGHGGGGR